MPWLEYQRDRVALSASFREFSRKDVERLLLGNEAELTPEEQQWQEAYKVWIEGQYGKVFGPSVKHPMTRATARAFMAALKAGHVPEWVMHLAPVADIRALSKEGDT